MYNWRVFSTTLGRKDTENLLIKVFLVQEKQFCDWFSTRSAFKCYKNVSANPAALFLKLFTILLIVWYAFQCKKLWWLCALLPLHFIFILELKNSPFCDSFFCKILLAILETTVQLLHQLFTCCFFYRAQKLKT